MLFVYFLDIVGLAADRASWLCENLWRDWGLCPSCYLCLLY